MPWGVNGSGIQYYRRELQGELSPEEKVKSAYMDVVENLIRILKEEPLNSYLGELMQYSSAHFPLYDIQNELGVGVEGRRSNDKLDRLSPFLQKYAETLMNGLGLEFLTENLLQRRQWFLQEVGAENLRWYASEIELKFKFILNTPPGFWVHSLSDEEFLKLSFGIRATTGEGLPVSLGVSKLDPDYEIRAGVSGFPYVEIDGSGEQVKSLIMTYPDRWTIFPIPRNLTISQFSERYAPRVLERLSN